MDEKGTQKNIDLNRLAVQPAGWELRGLSPLPEEEWERLKRFLELGAADYAAMLATVEPLFQHGIEMVAANYAYLAQNPETAAILGWESGADPAHLAERRRFFTVWLARTLGLDQSVELARYLFRAGQIHAGHGPRHIHVPPVFITGAVSRVQASFAATLAQEMPGYGQIGSGAGGLEQTADAAPAHDAAGLCQRTGLRARRPGVAGDALRPHARAAWAGKNLQCT